MQNTAVMAGSSDNAVLHYLQPSENEKSTNNNNHHNSNTAKKKSMERISRLFQKKPKKATPSFISSSISSLSIASIEPSTASSISLSNNNNNNNNNNSSDNHSSQSLPQRSSSLRTTMRANVQEEQPSHDLLLQEEAPSSADSFTPMTASNSQDSADEKSQQAKDDNSTTTSTTQEPKQVAALKAHLARQRRVLEDLQVESEQYQKDNQVLTEKLEKQRTKKAQRDEDIQALQANYDKHLRSLRATEDDLESIGAKIKQLKQAITVLAEQLVGSEYGDPVVATRALSTFWLNLHEAIQRMGCPLSRSRLQMLTEKFMMDVLVQNLNLNVFPGLSDEVVDAYNKLQYWFEENQHPQAMAIRLRQEIALLVARQEKDKQGDVYRLRHIALQNTWKYLYSGLVKAYPFVYQHDKAEPDVRKHYGAKVQLLVDQAISLGLAIKGQEVDITAAAVNEGEQPFDPELMVDEDGQESGIVEFCVAPPFVVRDANDIRTLEKGRVLCASDDR